VAFGIKKTPETSEEKTLPAPEKKVLRAPSKSYRIVDPEESPAIPQINIGLMGLPGSGKTKFIADLIENGARVFSINTDQGGAGMETIIAQTLKNKTSDKFTKNFREIQISDYDTLDEFLEKPEKFYPKIWDWNPHFLVWEGFANFQQTMISEKVGDLYREMAESGKKDKEASETRSEGFKLEMQDWGMVRNATIRRIEDFLQIQNPNRVSFPKILTIHEAVETVQLKQENGPPRTEERASNRPALQGGSKNTLGAGFTLILRTTRDGNKFQYENTSKTLGMTKNRGVEIPDGKFDASAMKVIQAIESSYNISLFERA
jgi:hypothetical protein